QRGWSAVRRDRRYEWAAHRRRGSGWYESPCLRFRDVEVVVGAGVADVVEAAAVSRHGDEVDLGAGMATGVVHKRDRDAGVAVALSAVLACRALLGHARHAANDLDGTQVAEHVLVAWKGDQTVFESLLER